MELREVTVTVATEAEEFHDLIEVLTLANLRESIDGLLSATSDRVTAVRAEIPHAGGGRTAAAEDPELSADELGSQLWHDLIELGEEERRFREDHAWVSQRPSFSGDDSLHRRGADPGHFPGRGAGGQGEMASARPPEPPGLGERMVALYERVELPSFPATAWAEVETDLGVKRGSFGDQVDDPDLVAGRLWSYAVAAGQGYR